MFPDIWWADLLRAQHALQATTDAEFIAIGKALGFGPKPAETMSEPNQPLSSDSSRAGGPFEPTEGADDYLLDQPEWVDESSIANSVVSETLQPVGEMQFASKITAGPTLPRSPTSQLSTRVSTSLLAPLSMNAILQYLLSKIVFDGQVDVPKLLEGIAAGKCVSALPRQRERTLRFGVQIMVDLGETMRPFRPDQAQVIDVVRAVVGIGGTETCFFANAPLRGAGSGARWTWKSYVPPAAESRILLLTDFGIGDSRLTPNRSSNVEWIEFFKLLHRHRCQPVALVPHPRRRWPRDLGGLCPMIIWDRNSTVGDARAAMR